MSAHILLINPNSSRATSDMMVAIARRAASGRMAVAVATAMRNPPMIVTPEQLDASAAEVVEIGEKHEVGCLGIVVSAFGDPGLAALKHRLDIPVIGICEASMIEASQGGRKFGVATTTPELIQAIDDRARDLGVWEQYTGIRCTSGDPLALSAHPDRLLSALGEAVRQCIELDGAEAVIIGGGPLGQAADGLQPMFSTPIIAPIPSAIGRMLDLMQVAA
ncbi:aspartate/glutamate racemase family protein [Hyphomicrobiales bacterium]|uniref:aspartate/glutamate racemase family protein n=1 Tax=Ensifer adhaerens TaxID=106592 RepID=UPI000DE1FF1D